MLYFEVFLLLKNVEQLHKEQRVDYFYVRQSISSILMDWASICSCSKSSQIRFYSCANKCWYRTKSVSVCPSLILRRPRSFAVPFASLGREAKGTTNDLGCLRITRLCMPTLWHRKGTAKGHFLERGLLLAQDLWKIWCCEVLWSWKPETGKNCPDRWSYNCCAICWHAS